MWHNCLKLDSAIFTSYDCSLSMFKLQFVNYSQDQTSLMYFTGIKLLDSNHVYMLKLLTCFISYLLYLLYGFMECNQMSISTHIEKSPVCEAVEEQNNRSQRRENSCVCKVITFEWENGQSWHHWFCWDSTVCCYRFMNAYGLCFTQSMWDQQWPW